jgi:hypothetical protein
MEEELTFNDRRSNFSSFSLVVGSGGTNDLFALAMLGAVVWHRNQFFVALSGNLTILSDPGLVRSYEPTISTFGGPPQNMCVNPETDTFVVRCRLVHVCCLF